MSLSSSLPARSYSGGANVAVSVFSVCLLTRRAVTEQGSLLLFIYPVTEQLRNDSKSPELAHVIVLS